LILLDDPAIPLHPSGQKDFLAVLDKISGDNQIIYTTHSPFLINKNFPARTRLVTKEKSGTLINNKPYSNGKSRFWEPLRTAIGVSLGDSLLLGGKNLIVEWVSDQFILTGFNHKFAAVDKPYVDLEEAAIVPAMGADSVVQLAILAYSEKLPTAILLDSDKQGDLIVKKIDKKMPELKKKVPIIRVKNFKKEAQTLEDLIPREDYLKAVNSAYSRTVDGFKKIKQKSIIKKEPEVTTSKQTKKEDTKPMVQFILEEFTRKEYGSFDKVLVAKELVNLIQPNDVQNDEYKYLVKLFENVKKHLNLT
jgi:predicted ATP-dependent endonuclease of OLD family